RDRCALKSVDMDVVPKFEMTNARANRATTDGDGSDWRAEERSRSRRRRLFVVDERDRRVRHAWSEREAYRKRGGVRARALARCTVFARSVRVVLGMKSRGS